MWTWNEIFAFSGTKNTKSQLSILWLKIFLILNSSLAVTCVISFSKERFYCYNCHNESVWGLNRGRKDIVSSTYVFCGHLIGLPLHQNSSKFTRAQNFVQSTVLCKWKLTSHTMYNEMYIVRDSISYSICLLSKGKWTTKLNDLNSGR